MIYKINSDSKHDIINYKEVSTLIDNNENVILDFSASWCKPCKRIYPSLVKLAQNYQQVHFYKVDIGETDDENLGEKFKITCLPTLVFIHKGNVIYTATGVQPGAKNIIDTFSNYINLIDSSNTTTVFDLKNKLQNPNPV